MKGDAEHRVPQDPGRSGADRQGAVHAPGAQDGTVREGVPRRGENPAEQSPPEDAEDGADQNIQRTGVSPSGGEPEGPETASVLAGRHGCRAETRSTEIRG